MSTQIAGRKSMFSRIAFTLALILLLSSIALPASASPPQDLSFTLDVTYADIFPTPAEEGFGTWSSGGLFSGSGDVYETYVIGGFNTCWITVHNTSVLTGPTPEDTITIRLQGVEVDGEPGCATFTAEGNWTILSATGAYAGLHGQGKAMISGGLQPGPGGTIDLVVHSELDGRGHFN